MYGLYLFLLFIFSINFQFNYILACRCNQYSPEICAYTKNPNGKSYLSGICSNDTLYHCIAKSTRDTNNCKKRPGGYIRCCDYPYCDNQCCIYIDLLEINNHGSCKNGEITSCYCIKGGHACNGKGLVMGQCDQKNIEYICKTEFDKKTNTKIIKLTYKLTNYCFTAVPIF